MAGIYIIKDLDQLKALSDPFRVRLMFKLIERPYTGQQLSEIFELSRARIHYHLKELEKLGLAEIVKTEEKNGIIQKFYQSVATGFYPHSSLFPHTKEISDMKQYLMLEMMEQTTSKLLSAPSEALEDVDSSEDPSESNMLASSWEIQASEDTFKWYIKEQFKLMEELDRRAEAEEASSKKRYFVSNYGFRVEEPVFVRVKDKDQ